MDTDFTGPELHTILNLVHDKLAESNHNVDNDKTLASIIGKVVRRIEDLLRQDRDTKKDK